MSSPKMGTCTISRDDMSPLERLVRDEAGLVESQLRKGMYALTDAIEALMMVKSSTWSALQQAHAAVEAEHTEVVLLVAAMNDDSVFSPVAHEMAVLDAAKQLGLRQ